ncbi:phenylacetaldoxime dehydratase family protein [Sphingomonas sp. CGMCC 1.13654]|uniref:Phenylacetaldoxime dehydratase family protein n=1 Tax=Sphingomonas chungangi TaxID=2683589 RepID=A0A838LA30_9SPHN|nr:phenylacetaldoxime dehydratase family protein [Sphingomonas chungangi]MBA2935750.1 phenylacetaldoxime dehydratase family protein [Sphingomonas chungangi]MVW54441.1 phenylacetaldoxime dehydratase [Sphingomonas chungangi]
MGDRRRSPPRSLRRRLACRSDGVGIVSRKSKTAPPPAWSATFAEKAEITVALYGAQARSPSDLGAWRMWIGAAVEQANGPDVCERARFVDAAGWMNEVLILYWRDPLEHRAWLSSAAIVSWWGHDDRVLGPVGIWREIVVVPSARFETILSEPAIRIGSGRIAPQVEGPIKTHGYWGSMRDRLPVSRHDALESDWGEALAVRASGDGSGRRISVRAPANLALIRSGQDASLCSVEEFSEYQRSIRPVLERGMDYLRDHPLESGCCACRFMTEVEKDGEPSERSFGFAWFLTLGDLERWSKSHPTHLAIYNVFSRYAQAQGADLQLRLWHEVAVIPAGGATFDYVNCHDRTGLLGFFPQTDAS